MYLKTRICLSRPWSTALLYNLSLILPSKTTARAGLIEPWTVAGRVESAYLQEDGSFNLPFIQ